MTTNKMKVGMVFDTTAYVDLTIKDFDDSPRYIKLESGLYFRDYSKEYEDWFWNIHTIKNDFDFDCRKFVRENPDHTFVASIHLLLFDTEGKIIQDVKLDYE